MTTRGNRLKTCVIWLCAAGGLLSLAGCNRAGGAPRADDSEVAGLNESPGEVVRPQQDAVALELAALRKRGDLPGFVTAATRSVESSPHTLLLKAEAQLAMGSHGEAASSALAAAGGACRVDPLLAEQALKLWLTARCRDRQSVKSPEFDELRALLPPDLDGLQMLGFWRDALIGRVPYDASNESFRGQVPIADSQPETLPAALNAIEAEVNGTRLPLVFIDTGAQHTLITRQAAEAAGVTMGPGSTRLVGFGGIEARPGLIDRLQIGPVEVRNVPVLVGNSAPLTALDGQMSLGTELMHHVRFTIDYPQRLVWAAPAGAEMTSPELDATWTIPLWTFPQATLAQGTTADGRLARVLVDTGDRAGTFLSSRWARRNVPGFHRSTAPIVFKFKRRDLALDQLTLGDQTLRNWAVLDTMPQELERLDLVDVLVGHDLLWPYRVTIDLAGRRLLLAGAAPTAVFQPETGAGPGEPLEETGER